MRNPMAGVLARGVVVLANATRKLQSLQLRITAGEVKDDMEHLEPYGFTSCPHEGAEAVAGFIGDRSMAWCWWCRTGVIACRACRPVK